MLASSALMANRGYYYGTPYSRGSSGGVPLFFIFLGVFLFVSFVGGKARRRQ